MAARYHNINIIKIGDSYFCDTGNMLKYSFTLSLFDYLSLEFTTVCASCIQINIYIFIFDPDLALTRVILTQCALCEKTLQNSNREPRVALDGYYFIAVGFN